MSNFDLGTLIEETKRITKQLQESEYQYGVTYTGVNHGGQYIDWIENTGDQEDLEEELEHTLRIWRKRGQNPRIVRRLVSEPEEVTE